MLTSPQKSTGVDTNVHMAYKPVTGDNETTDMIKNMSIWWFASALVSVEFDCTLV